MSVKEKNHTIVKMVRDEITRRGLAGKMDVYPVENTFTRRPRFWNDGCVNLFKIHMWDLNKLSGSELNDEITARVDQAQKHFSL
jgi:hypothetical protein